MKRRKIPSICEQMADYQKRIAKQREKQGLEPLPAVNMNELVEKAMLAAQEILEGKVPKK